MGRNAIAALARFYGLPGPWWRPAPPSFLIGFGSFAFESPAIGVSSDSSWKGRAAPYRQDVTRGQALPVPTQFVINLSTAKALGIEVPPPLSARADEVIE